MPGTILGTNIPDDFIKLRYSNTGAYAQWQYAATPLLAFTVGARGDYNTRYGGTFNPRVGLVLKTDNDTTLKLLYGTAYLAPSPYEAYSHYGSFYTTDGGATYASDYWHLPNPDLRPQQKKTVEANVLQVARRVVRGVRVGVLFLAHRSAAPGGSRSARTRGSITAGPSPTSISR